MVGIRKEDVNFVVDKEKRTVVCYVEKTRTLFRDFVNENELMPYYYLEKSFLLPDRFVGKAVCSVDDEWNEECGKLLAYHRMRNQITGEFVKAANAYVNAQRRELEKAENMLQDYVAKLDFNSARRRAKLGMNYGVS